MWNGDGERLYDQREGLSEHLNECPLNRFDLFEHLNVEAIWKGTERERDWDYAVYDVEGALDVILKDSIHSI